MYHPDFGLPVSYSVEVVGDDPEEQVARTGEGGGGEKRNNCSRKTALDGEFLLGQTNSGQSFGLTREEVNRHVFISGQSGVGKSTLIDNLFRRGHELGVHCVHFDRKGDLEHLARDGVESYSWRHLRINPLCPPSTLVDISEYRNDFVKAFCELNQFMQRGTSLFMRGVDELYRAFGVYERWRSWEWGARPFPTLADLLSLFRSLPATPQALLW